MGVNEQDVTIPVYIDVEYEKDLKSKLSKLRSEMEKAGDIRIDKRGGMKNGFSYVNQQIDRSIVTIGRYLKAMHELGDDDSAAKQAQSFKSLIDSEMEKIDELINKSAKLKEAMQVQSNIDNLVPSQKQAPKETDAKWMNVTSVKELNDYLDQTEQKLAAVQKLLETTPSNGNSVMESSRRSIIETTQSIQNLTQKLGEVASEYDKTEREAKEATDAYTSASRVLKAMKSGEGIFGSVPDRDVKKQEELTEQLKETASTARMTNNMMQTEAASTSRKIQGEIDELIKKLQELSKEYSNASKGVVNGKKWTRASKLPQPSDTSSDEAAKSAERSAVAHNREAEAIKNSTAQYYYKLRAVKMLGFVVNQASKAVNDLGKTTLKVTGKMLSAYLRLIPGITSVRKALDKTSSSQKKLNNETKKATKSNKLMDMSFKDLIKNVLKYGLGIRSLFVLFNKLRRAITDGLKSMSKQFDDVNQRMSSIVTSFNQMKAALTSIFEPILTVLAPALERLAAAFANLAYKIASFIAALTGQSMVYKAIRVQTDYAASLDKTAKSAKKAKKELAGFDELNVLHSDKDNGGGDDGGMGWEKVPIDPWMKEVADKFKDFLKRLFAPIKAAWEKWKAWVLAQFKYALGELLALGRDMARDFWKVWEEYDTQKIFENMFHVLGDIARIVGNLARNFRKAWNVNKNGYRILKAVRDIILAITDSLVDMADYTVKWSENLDFIPAMTHLADAMQNKLVPAVKQVCELFETLYEQILLKIIKDFIEKGLPDLFTMAGKVAEIIGTIAEKIDFAIKSGSNGINIIDKMEGLIGIVADHIQSALDKTKEWAKELDFRNLLKGIKQFLEDMKPAVEAISSVLENMWNNVLLPFWKYLIETGFPKLLENLGKVNTAADWEKITDNINTFVDGLEPLFELSWDVLVQLVTDAYKALSNLFKSDEFGEFAQKFKDFFTELRDDEDAPARIAEKIEDLADKFIKLAIELTIASKVLLPVVTGIMTIGNILNTTGMAKNISSIATAVGTGAGGEGLAGAFAGLSGVIGPVVIAILAVVAAIALMVGAFGGVEETMAEIKERIDDVRNSLAEFAEKVGLSDTIDRLKESFSRMGDSVQNLRPIFEFALDVLADFAKVIGKTVIGALDGFLTVLDGVVNVVNGVFDVIGGLIEVITNLVKGDYAAADKGLETMITGLGEIFYGLLETVTGVFNGIAEAIAGFVDEALPGLAQGVTDFVNDVKDAFAWLKHVLIGDPIVYDIQDGVEKGFGDFIKNTLEGVTGWVKNIKDEFAEIKEGISEKVSEAKDKVVDKFSELKEGAVSKFSEFKEKIVGSSEDTAKSTENAFTDITKKIASTIKPDALKKPATDYIKSFKTTITTEMKTFTGELTTMLDNITKLYQTKLSASVMSNISKVAMDGFNNGLKSGTNTAKSLVTSICNQIISTFNSKLNKNTLKDVGANLIAGLQEGMKSKTKELEETTKELSERVVSISKEVFDEASPSKVFKKIGQFVVEGLKIGLTQDDGYYTSFINNLSNMSVSAIDIVSDMISDMDDTFSKFEPAFNLDNTFKQLDKFKDVQMPNIVTGKMLPANARFKTDDMSNLAGALKNAIVDAMSVPSYNNYRDEQDIVIQIDGYEVFRAVRNQSDRFKNSTGYGVL